MGSAFLCPALQNVFFRLTADTEYDTSGSGVGRSDTALHKNVSGDVKWAKGVQINRPNENVIRKWLEKVL